MNKCFEKMVMCTYSSPQGNKTVQVFSILT